MKKRGWLNILIAVPLVFLMGCLEKGMVDQGRVISYDKTMHTVMMIRDKNADSQKPDYTFLPPQTYVLPTEPLDMGPEPKAGGRMKFDAEKGQIVIFNPALQNFETISIKVVDKKENIEKTDPLVYDAEHKAAKKFPVVEKEKATVTIYSSRQKMLASFVLPESYMSMPESTWDSGDEARIYYKEAGKALRFMNVSKTDLFK
jgi:hypothetical protein